MLFKCLFFSTFFLREKATPSGDFFNNLKLPLLRSMGS